MGGAPEERAGEDPDRHLQPPQLCQAGRRRWRGVPQREPGFDALMLQQEGAPFPAPAEEARIASRKAEIPKPARTDGKQRKRVVFHASRRIHHTSGAGLQVGAGLNKA